MKYPASWCMHTAFINMLYGKKYISSLKSRRSPVLIILPPMIPMNKVLKKYIQAMHSYILSFKGSSFLLPGTHIKHKGKAVHISYNLLLIMTFLWSS